MPTNTYVALDKATVSGTATTSITFSSIPATYTDLVVIANVKYSIADTNFSIQLNGDTGSNYSATLLYGTGSAAGSYRATGATSIEAGAYAYPGTEWTTTRVQIQNYSNTTTNKTLLSRADASTGQTRAIVGMWRNTAAVNSVTVVLPAYLSPTYVAGSTFSLYGIASEAAGAKATGGYITSDANYYYHTFFSTGTFTPLQALSVDCLVLAGGGAGGNTAGGGGGAGGGYRTGASLSVTATNYTVTVGAGGAIDTNPPSAGGSGSDSVFSTITSTGGGGGGGGNVGNPARNGGSGGGGGVTGDLVSSARGLGNTPSTSPSQGNNGGTSLGVGSGATRRYTGGGGGGSGAVGSNADGTNAGNGAVGTATSFIGTSVTYAGGGGGGAGRESSASSVTRGTGGTGGGGGGADSGNDSVAGSTNTGGGGGGGDQVDSKLPSNGGSGVVIIRYPKA